MSVAVDFTAVTRKVQKHIIVIANIATILAVVNFTVDGELSTFCTAGVVISVIIVVDHLYRTSVKSKDVPDTGDASITNTKSGTKGKVNNKNDI